jgi:hypothetical protein
VVLTHPDLLKLPIFTVDSAVVEGDLLTIHGTFSFFTDFYEGSLGGSFLYDPPLHYVGDVEHLDRKRLTATFTTYPIEGHEVKGGDSFCWLYGYYQPYYLNFLMDSGLWEPVRYADPGHEHCLICDRHICGWPECPQYRDEVSYHCEEAGWVCSLCFNRYLASNSLAFVVPEGGSAA